MVDMARIRTKMIMGFTVKRNVDPEKDDGFVGQLERRKSKLEDLPNENGVLETRITRA